MKYPSAFKISISGLKMSTYSLKIVMYGLNISLSGLKILISGLRISISGLKMLISGLKIPISGLKLSLFGLKISISSLKMWRARARSQTLVMLLSYAGIQGLGPGQTRPVQKSFLFPLADLSGTCVLVFGRVMSPHCSDEMSEG